MVVVISHSSVHWEKEEMEENIGGKSSSNNHCYFYLDKPLALGNLISEGLSIESWDFFPSKNFPLRANSADNSATGHGLWKNQNDQKLGSIKKIYLVPVAEGEFSDFSSKAWTVVGVLAPLEALVRLNPSPLCLRRRRRRLPRGFAIRRRSLQRRRRCRRLSDGQRNRLRRPVRQWRHRSWRTFNKPRSSSTNTNTAADVSNYAAHFK